MLNNSLDEDGFAIVRNVLTPAECEHAVHNLKTDPTAGHAHSTFMWNMRTHASILKVFARVWSSSAMDLVSSFDGAAIKTSKDRPFVLDWHVDQNGTHEPGRVCIQAVLLLTRMDKASGGTAFLKGSHRSHKDLCARLCSEDESDDEWEFVPIPSDDPIFEDRAVVQPSIDVGSMLLWDSRTAHCVKPPTDALSCRALVYLSMVPRAFVSDDVLEQRRNGFEQGVATTHWSSRFVDRGAARAPPVRSILASHRVRRLVGFVEA